MSIASAMAKVRRKYKGSSCPCLLDGCDREVQQVAHLLPRAGLYRIFAADERNLLPCCNRSGNSLDSLEWLTGKMGRPSVEQRVLIARKVFGHEAERRMLEMLEEMKLKN